MAKAKGCSHAAPGKFGKLFGLPGLDVNEAEAEALAGPGSPMHDANNSSPDSPLPSGYTFFAQFVDHDITLDTTTDLHGQPLSNKAISKLPNLRTASLDLDCVYGFGPEASPHLYDPDAPGRLLEGNVHNPNDVPRNESGTALIGDPRNDENIFVSQMQLLWIRFHNAMYDQHIAKYGAGDRFEETQKQVRYHYQFIVLHDFLWRVCDSKTFLFALERLNQGQYPLFNTLANNPNGAMPVEFSVAAYRFGHTLVRSRYAVNGRYPDIDLFDERFGTEGFSFVPPKLTVDWRFLLEVDACIPPVMGKAFDEKLADELIRLPDPIVGRSTSDNDRSLAFRNILRGNVLALPCGQAVAQALAEKGYPVDPDADLQLAEGLNVQDCSVLKRFVDETPLFYYILREANILGQGERLGPVGSAIILEVFLGMLINCKTSFLKEDDWLPATCVKGDDDSRFELADIVRFTNSCKLAPTA
ncbi:peroxidase family protein [Cerasicoccus frondis]|uniref:peroxidase family protein n=1 Tax=Cerasicoccus frondis TaxID=490090 RepID=UPI002852646A|nr:heme peroxidase family protein [Cerasicoccus frondis]